MQCLRVLLIGNRYCVQWLRVLCVRVTVWSAAGRVLCAVLLVAQPARVGHEHDNCKCDSCAASAVAGKRKSGLLHVVWACSCNPLSSCCTGLLTCQPCETPSHTWYCNLHGPVLHR